MGGLNIAIHLSRLRQDLDVEATLSGGITTIFGPSGAGKTTLLRCMAGLEPTVAGTIRCGTDTWLDHTGAIPTHRRGIGFCFQDSRILPHLNVFSNLRFSEWMRWFQHDRRPSCFTLDEIIERLKLNPFINRMGRRLSGGEARRVSLGRALLSARTLLALDEPFNGLSMDMRNEVRELIADFHRRTNIPVLLVTHHVQELQGISKEMLLLHNGRSVACGMAGDLLRKPHCALLAAPLGLLNVLPGCVRWQDPQSQTTLCQIAPPEDTTNHYHTPMLRAPYVNEPAGMRIHFGLDPCALSLSPCPGPRLETGNQWAARILSATEINGITHFRVNAGIELTAHIDTTLAREMRLMPESAVWCSFRTDQLTPLPHSDALF